MHYAHNFASREPPRYLSAARAQHARMPSPLWSDPGPDEEYGVPSGDFSPQQQLLLGQQDFMLAVPGVAVAEIYAPPPDPSLWPGFELDEHGTLTHGGAPATAAIVAALRASPPPGRCNPLTASTSRYDHSYLTWTGVRHIGATSRIATCRGPPRPILTHLDPSRPIPGIPRHPPASPVIPSHPQSSPVIPGHPARPPRDPRILRSRRRRRTQARAVRQLQPHVLRGPL